jgi:hypothetical protein
MDERAVKISQETPYAYEPIARALAAADEVGISLDVCRRAIFCDGPPLLLGLVELRRGRR